MHTSLFDLFKIGIGPSSSHTVGPMRAAHQFVTYLLRDELLEIVSRVEVELFGSLALTGLGHGIDRGILLGLMGCKPDEVEPCEITALLETLRTRREPVLFDRHPIAYSPNTLIFRKEELLPGHSNGMRFTAYAFDEAVIETRIFYSIGGGFITEDGQNASHQHAPGPSTPLRPCRKPILPHSIAQTYPIPLRFPRAFIRVSICAIRTCSREWSNSGDKYRSRSFAHSTYVRHSMATSVSKTRCSIP